MVTKINQERDSHAKKETDINKMTRWQLVSPSNELRLKVIDLEERKIEVLEIDAEIEAIRKRIQEMDIKAKSAPLTKEEMAQRWI